MNEKDEDLYDLSEDLRLQLVVLELEDKIHKYIYDTQKDSIKKKYRVIRVAKVIIIFFYTILVFFEKPMFCYNSTTFYNRENKYDNKCPPELAYLNENIFIDESLYRYIEIVFLISFVFIKVMHFKLKNIDIFKKINLYNIIQYIIFLLILLCLIDIILSIILDYFPLMNFFFRGILIILLIKSQRKMWAVVFKIFYHTRVLTFLIFCVMLFFGIVGFYLFGNKSDDFSSVPLSIYSLFILLSTCNFPDVMLGTFSDDNKYPFLFFLLYLAINYFILFTLLKTLYYTHYFDSLKAEARKAIDAIYGEFHKNDAKDENGLFFDEEESEEDKEEVKIKLEDKKDEKVDKNEQKILEAKEGLKAGLLSPEESSVFNKILFNLNRKFYLTKNDYIKILRLIGYEGEMTDFTKNDIYQLLNQKEKNIKEEINEIKKNNKILRFFNHRYTELAINIIDFGMMMVLFVAVPHDDEGFMFVIIPQIVWCSVFVFELTIYLKHISIKVLIVNEVVLSAFFIINFLTLFFLLLTFIFLMAEEEDGYIAFIYIVKAFVSIRMVRIILLFKKYNTFETFSRTIKNMKNIFYSLFSTLFSFFYMFTTITMALTGGHIRKDSFVNDSTIPEDYSNINFNDFGSGFLSCFCLTMINNINIISKSLAYECSQYFQGYFALFYFLSTLVILNIFTTLLLEMYMSIHVKMKEIMKNKRNEPVDEEMTLGEES